MTKVIYKYKIDDEDYADPRIKLPAWSKILYVGVQKGDIYIWALIDKDENLSEYVTFRIVATGEDMEQYFLNSHDYIGTVQIESFVWHIYKRIII